MLELEAEAKEWNRQREHEIELRRLECYNRSSGIITQIIEEEKIQSNLT